jgi:glycosyltransferase involved in cell wall biosynthesis
LIHQLDTKALQHPRTRKVFSIGNEVSKRLLRWNALDSEVLHPPLGLDGFRTDGYGDYLLLPGRLHRWKRVDLAIRSMDYVRHPVRLVITGTGEQEAALRSLAAGSDRVEFRGRVSDRDLIDLYAGALGVLFVPLQEDYGYVTVEAFRSAKAVITCRDSGEPAVFVRNAVNGFVCNPGPRDIADAIRRLCEDRQAARRLGEQGRADTLELQWPRVVDKLATALGA